MNKKNNLLVSIGIPTYNRASNNLSKAVSCAINQTYSNLEIIVSDNFSTDNTKEIIDGFDDPRLQYYQQKNNIGPNNNFNFCLMKAVGTYFLLLHDDDMIDSDFIETCIKEVDSQDNVGVIRTGTRVINENDEVTDESENLVKGYSHTEFLLGWISNKTAFYLCSTLYNTKRLKEAGGFKSNTNLFQDVVAICKLSSRYGRGDIVDIKASFRRHSGNRGSAVNVLDWCKDSLYLLNVMENSVSKTEREIFTKKAKQYLCTKNCRHVLNNSSFFYKIYSYFVVINMFKSYSFILRFIFRYEVKHKLREIKKRITSNVFST